MTGTSRMRTITHPGGLLSKRSSCSTSDSRSHTNSRAPSVSSRSSWRLTVPRQTGRGAVLFTGPDRLGDHRVTVEEEHRYVGEGTMSLEGTSETSYLWRAPSGMPPPRPKSASVGEIGWGIPMFSDYSAPRTGNQIYLGEFRQLCEDRHTHQYQNPWYPGPNEVLPQNSDAALVMNIYNNNSNNNNRLRRSTSRVPAATPIYNYANLKSWQIQGNNTNRSDTARDEGSTTSRPASLRSNHSRHSLMSSRSGARTVPAY